MWCVEFNISILDGDECSATAVLSPNVHSLGSWVVPRRENFSEQDGTPLVQCITEIKFHSATITKISDTPSLLFPVQISTRPRHPVPRFQCEGHMKMV